MWKSPTSLARPHPPRKEPVPAPATRATSWPAAKASRAASAAIKATPRIPSARPAGRLRPQPSSGREQAGRQRPLTPCHPAGDSAKYRKRGRIAANVSQLHRLMPAQGHASQRGASTAGDGTHRRPGIRRCRHHQPREPPRPAPDKERKTASEPCARGSRSTRPDTKRAGPHADAGGSHGRAERSHGNRGRGHRPVASTHGGLNGQPAMPRTQPAKKARRP